MTSSRLRELSRLASPAPWRCDKNGSGCYGPPDFCPTYIRDNPSGPTEGYVVASVVADCVPQHAANAELLVALRNDAEKYADLRDAVEAYRDCLKGAFTPATAAMRRDAMFAALAALGGEE